MMYIFHKQSGYFDIISKVVQNCMNDTTIESNDPNQKGTWVLFFTSFKSGFYKKITEPYIVVQTEIPEITFKRFPEYEIMCDNATKILDFSTNLKFGYSDIYRIQCEEAKEIDVLFYGVLSERRKKILDSINCNKTILHESPGICGLDLWKYINKSKIVLNISCYDNRFEPDWVRLAPLLSNKVFVITESVGDKNFSSLSPHIAISDYENIPTIVKHFLKNPLARAVWADKGFDYIIKNKSQIIQNGN